MINIELGKRIRIGWQFLPLFFLFILLSCREGFDDEFRELEIINNAPAIGTIDTLRMTVGSQSEIDFSRYATDKESEPLSYSASSANETIATITSVAGALFNVEALALGNVMIDVVVGDGNDGNDTESSFVVSVVESFLPPAAFSLDFDDVPNGTDITSVSLPDGGTIDFFDEEDGGASATIQSGAIEFDLNGNGSTAEVIGAMTLNFGSPVDISDNPVFEFDYANAFSGAAFYILIFDGAGGEFILADGYDNIDNFPEWIVGDPNFNTLSTDLSQSGLDLTNITSIYFEGVSTGTGQLQLDNFVLGPPDQGFSLTSFIFTLDGVADGTELVNVSLPDGGTIDFLDDGDGGATATVLDEAINLDLNGSAAEVIGAITMTFAEPIDASETPLFEFDYANAFSGAAFYILLFDGAGGDFILADGYDNIDNFEEWVVDDSNYNTLSVDLTDSGLDLTQITSIYFEAVSQGAGAVQVDNIRLNSAD